MRILIVTHYFPPETGAPQARLSALAATWAADGDQVTVLTGMPNHPTGIIPPEYRGALRRRERRDGYRVLRTWLYATPNEGIVRKTLGHLSFMLSSVLLGADSQRARRCRRGLLADLLLDRLGVAAGPAEAGQAGGGDPRPVASHLHRTGRADQPPVIGLLERLELAAYAAADEIVVVSEGFRANLISRGVPPGKIHTIRNGTSPGQFDPAARPDPAVRAALGASPGDCLVLYLGTHGISQGLPGIADAAARLAAHPVHFAFVGDGADKARLQQKVTRLGLRNVTLRPGVPHEEVPALLAAADICLVPLRDVPLFATFIPSKMFEYLAAGKSRDRLGHRRGRPDPAGGRRPRGPAGGQRGAGRRHPRTGHQPAAPPGHGPGRPDARRAVLRPRRAGPRVPQDPGRRGRPAMRLLVTGGSGFLGGYVLDEARRRGHEVVALARSDKAAAAVTGHGAEPLTGDFDDPAGLPDVFSSARCASLLNIASLGFGHAPGHPGRRPGGGYRPRRLPLHHGGDHHAPGPVPGRAADGRGADPGVRAEVDDPAPHHDLRRAG